MEGAFGELDLNVLAQALARAGMDTRVWCSYAIVNREQQDQHSTDFDTEFGPVVWVTMQPYNQVVACRVAHKVAGNGEAEWHPFLEGDEVLVVLPEGDVRAFPVIIGRLNNSIDKFPEKVAGQDTNLNNFGFVRRRVPFLQEFVGGMMLRQTMANGQPGAMIGFDETGNVTLRNGLGDVLQMGPSGIAIQDKEGTGQIVLNHEKGEVTAWWDNTLLKLNGTDINMMAKGNINLGSSGNQPVLHGISAESVVSLIAAAIDQLMVLGAFVVPPASGDAVMAAALVLPTAGVLAAALAPLLARLQMSLPASPLTPGVGCAGINVG